MDWLTSRELQYPQNLNVSNARDEVVFHYLDVLFLSEDQKYKF